MLEEDFRRRAGYDASYRVVGTFWDLDKCTIGLRSGFNPDRNNNAELYEDIFEKISLAVRLRHFGIPFDISLMIGIILDYEARCHGRTFETFFEGDPRSGVLIHTLHAILHNVVLFHVSTEAQYQEPDELQQRIDFRIIDFIKISSLWDIPDFAHWFAGHAPAPEGTLGHSYMLDKWANPQDVLFFRMIGDCYITASEHWMREHGTFTYNVRKRRREWQQRIFPNVGVCPTCICSNVIGEEVASKVLMPYHKTAIEPSIASFQDGLMTVVEAVEYIEHARRDSLGTESEDFMGRLTEGLMHQVLSRNTLKALYRHHPLRALEFKLVLCTFFTDQLMDCLETVALDVARDFLNDQLRQRRVKRYTLRANPSAKKARKTALLWLTGLRRACESGKRPKPGTHASIGEADDVAFAIRMLDEIENAVYGLRGQDE